MKNRNSIGRNRTSLAIVDYNKSRREKDKLSSFLESFPTEIDSTTNESIPRRRIFWSRNSSDNNDDVHDKIKSAFCKVNAHRLKGLLQFWAPTRGGGGSLILSSSEQPFALEDLNKRVHKYRLFSLKCRDSSCIVEEKKEDDSSLILISNGLVATAFGNHFPQVVMDLKFHKGRTPLVDKALDSGFSCLILLPVFNSSSSSCVGVVECCLKKLTSTNLVLTFNKLKKALESVGLSTYQPQPLPHPYNEMAIVKHEIEDALKIACESHCLSLAHVWVPNGTDNTFVLKLCGYRHHNPYGDNDDKAVLDYYNTCDMLPLKMGEGLAGMTLKTHESRFSEDLSNLKKNKGEGLLGLLGRNTDCSCLVICLRTTLTGDLNYAFEFLWPDTRNHSILLKSLVLTLKMCLPSFQFAQPGHELRVVDLDRSTRNEIASFKILHGDLLLSSTEVSLSLKQKLKRTPLPMKRKSGSLNDCHDSETFSDSESYSDFSENDDENVEEQDMIIFVGDFRGTLKPFPLLSPFTLADAKHNIEKGFKLAPGTFTLEYRFNEGDFTLKTNEDLVSWVKCWRSAKRGNGHMMNFTLYVACSK